MGYSFEETENRLWHKLVHAAWVDESVHGFVFLMCDARKVRASVAPAINKYVNCVQCLYEIWRM